MKPEAALQPALIKQQLPVWAVPTLFSSLLVLMIGSQLFTSSVFAWFALVYYAVFCGLLAKHVPSAFILMLWFIFIRFTTMVSGVAIESGGYMPEMLMSGFANGAFIRLALFYTIGILGAVAILNAFLPAISRTPANSPPVQKWAYAAFGLIIALCIWAVLIGLKNGFPLLQNIDRVVYWNQVSNRFLFFFLGNRPIFAALLGLIYASSTGSYRRGALGLILLILLLSFLFAEKFTSICQILFFFVTPVFLLNPVMLRNTARRMIPLGLLITAITMPVVLVVYGVLEDPANAIDRLKTRATAQSEVWFVADMDDGSLLGYKPELANYNIKSLLSLDADAMSRTSPYLGARDFMSQYLETPRYNSYVERGVTLTMATEGYLIKAFGWVLGVPAYLALIAAYCLQLLYLAFAIYQRSPLRLIIACKLLVWSNFGLNQGYFWDVIGIQIIAIMAAIAWVEVYLSHLHPTTATKAA